MTALDFLIELLNQADPASPEATAYQFAIDLFDRLDNLNVVTYQLLREMDAADNANYSEDYHARYVAALNAAREVVLQTRLDDE